MRPIDADKLKRKAQKVGTEAWKMNLIAKVETTLNQFIDWIDEQPTIQPEKTQLSKEGATSDLISKTETVEHLRRMLEATVPNTDYDEGFVDGVEFGISTVSTMPTIQPQSTTGQLNDGARSTARSTELIERRATIDAVNNAFDRETLLTGFVRSIAVRAIRDMPPAQPELTDEQAITHLQSSGWMQRHDKEMYESGLKEYLADDSDSYDSLLPSAQPEPKEGHWIEVAGELECSECHTAFTDLYPDYADSVACPHCGTKMTISTK